jgi:long-chain fatty acid transport protein
MKMTARYGARLCVATATLAALLATTGTAHAGGFAISEQGATSGALAGAVTARQDLPEAGFYNPASYIAKDGIKPFSFTGVLGATLLRPTIQHTSPDGEVTQVGPENTPVPRLHLGGGVGMFGGSLSLDVPFGSSIDWGEDWAGRYEIKSSSLQVLELGANVAVRPIRFLSLSGGVRLQSSTLGIARDIDVADPERDTSVNITGSAAGVGGQASLLLRPIEQFTIGFSYRSRVTHNFEGVANFDDVPIELEDRAHDTQMTTRFVMPGRFAFGLAFDHGSGTASADVEYFTWSSTEQLVIDFEDEQMDDVVQPRGWKNTLALRLGYEHRLLADLIALRAGFAYDAPPVPDQTVGPSSPDGPRITGALGAGVRAPFGLLANVSASYTKISEREVVNEASLPGSYEGSFLALGLDIGFDF